MLTFRFTKADGRMVEEETLTSGMVGREMRLEFSDDWDGVSKTVVFTAGGECRDVANPGEVVVIPHEVLAESRNQLYVGVYGVAADGRVIPSVRARGPYIHPGVDPAGDESADPTPSAWDQVQQQLAGVGEEIRQMREENRLHIASDGAGNVTIRAQGIADDGAGNIAFFCNP